MTDAPVVIYVWVTIVIKRDIYIICHTEVYIILLLFSMHNSNFNVYAKCKQFINLDSIRSNAQREKSQILVRVVGGFPSFFLFDSGQIL